LQEEFGGTELFGQKWSTHVQKPRPLNIQQLKKNETKRKRWNCSFLFVFGWDTRRIFFFFGREKKGGNKNTICDFIIF
jgi:hypothetical protein